MHKIKKDGEEFFFNNTDEFRNYLDYISIYDEKLESISYYVDPEKVDNDEDYFEIIKRKDKNFKIPESCKNRYDFDELIEAAQLISDIQDLFSE